MRKEDNFGEMLFLKNVDNRTEKLGNQSSNSYLLLVLICCHLNYHPCPDKMPGTCPVTLIFHFI